MREDVYRELVKVARKRGTITYKVLGKSVFPEVHYHYRLGEVLGEISEDQSEKHRPLISVVAVLADSETALCPKGYPSGGFFGIDSDRIPEPLARSRSHYKDAYREVHERFIASEQEAVWGFAWPSSP